MRRAAIGAVALVAVALGSSGCSREPVVDAVRTNAERLRFGPEFRQQREVFGRDADVASCLLKLLCPGQMDQLLLFMAADDLAP